MKLRTATPRVIFTILLSLSFIGFSAQIIAQTKATVKGRIVDGQSGEGLGYASIKLMQVPENKMITGTVSDEKGTFSMLATYGKYVAEIEFIGFSSIKTAEFILSKEHAVHDLGVIKLGAASKNLDEVVVQAERSSMVLALDKKVFNVGKDLANTGGSASDILTNIPSVSVDPEGNVKLRGSDNVRILIDGKPSGLVSFKGGAGLSQLQASMIERVEIITNPSARYEAEGMAGIINIILKKDTKQGFNGSIEALAGQPTNYGLATNFNYRHQKINFFINYSLAYRRSPSVGTLYQEVYGKDTTFILDEDSRTSLKGFNTNIRGGLDYYFNEKSILTAAYLLRRSDVNRLRNIRYNDYIFNFNNFKSYTDRTQNEDEKEPNSEYTLTYKRKFLKEGQELTAEAKYLHNWENSDQVFTQHTFAPNGAEDANKAILQTSVNDEFEKHWLFQLDYVHPLSKDTKFETGARSSFRDMINDYIVNNKDAAGNLTPLPGLDNYFIYKERIHAAYGIFGDKRKKFSYQLGLRSEYTEATTILRETNEKYPRNYFKLFPSAHFTYQLSEANAFQLSYSRRVRRPVYDDLSPFMTFSDSRNFTSGNPDLNPEFSNVFEIGHINYFEKGSLSSSVYYRQTTDKIDRIRTVDALGNSVTIPKNINGEKAFGVEFAAAYTPIKWWKLDFNANFFHANIDGSNIVATYKATTYSWFARQTSRFMLPNNFDIQLRGNYEAPQKTAQGSRQALYFIDLSASKDILKNKGTLTLNAMDLFNTRRARTITEGANFYTRSDFQWRRRQINLTFSYRINQNKGGKKKGLSVDDN